MWVVGTPPEGQDAQRWHFPAHYSCCAMKTSWKTLFLLPFQALPACPIQATCEAASKEENKEKNRYVNILPCTCQSWLDGGGVGGNTQGLLPGLPIPGFGMGKGTDEGISPPRWVAVSALALDACEEKLHGALSSQEAVQSERFGKCQKGQLLPGGTGQWQWLGVSSNMHSVEKKTTLDKI